jgi:ankyrin repeat protein
MKSASSQISVEYWFPSSFFSSTIVRMQVGFQPNIGTHLQLDTLRRVPDAAQCVNFALNGDIEGLKYLFSHGFASPRDVSTTRGYSLLRWALYGKQYEACEFLIHAGADPDYRPIAETDNSPRNKACHFLLEGGLSGTAVEALRVVTRDGYLDDFIEEAGFTQTHRIVLGLSFLSLEEEITRNPEDIDVVDAMGRTPLAWAAARGDTRTIVTLLGHGADQNIIDTQLSGPLSNAAAQGHTVSVRLLLEAGALPDHPSPRGERKGSPLNCAARNATDVLLLKSLLDFGADVNSSGTDGKTALIHAARKDNASFAMLLLENGADINAMSVDGSTPLTTAITYNSHNVLRLILDRWHEYSTCPRLKGPHLLQITSLYADLETLRILAATDHFRMKYDRQYTLGDFGSRFRQRPDLTDKLAEAFDDLLSIINQMPDQRVGTEGLLESGCFPCLPSRVNTNLEGLAHDPKSSSSSEGSFRDAFEYLQLANDDISTLESTCLV